MTNGNTADTSTAIANQTVTAPDPEYVTDQLWAGGLVLRRKRESFVRDRTGWAARQPLIVSIRIDQIEVG